MHTRVLTLIALAAIIFDLFDLTFGVAQAITLSHNILNFHVPSSTRKGSKGGYRQIYRQTDRQTDRRLGPLIKQCAEYTTPRLLKM